MLSSSNEDVFTHVRGVSSLKIPIIRSKIKVIVNLSVTYENQSVEKYKTNRKRINSIQHTKIRKRNKVSVATCHIQSKIKTTDYFFTDFSSTFVIDFSTDVCADFSTNFFADFSTDFSTDICAHLCAFFSSEFSSDFSTDFLAPQVLQ